MPGPRIAPYFEVSHDVGLALGEGCVAELSDERQLFVVLKGGYCMGYWWKRGDVIVCGTLAASAANVVLMPKGYGWPRLGRQSGYGHLSGDAGEPCRLDRWAVVGSIEYVLRRDSADIWQQVILGDALESPLDIPTDGWDQPKVRRQSFAVKGWSVSNRKQGMLPTRQLSLFTGPAIAA